MWISWFLGPRVIRPRCSKCLSPLTPLLPKVLPMGTVPPTSHNPEDVCPTRPACAHAVTSLQGQAHRSPATAANSQRRRSHPFISSGCFCGARPCQGPRSQPGPACVLTAMEALGPGGERTSPRSLHLRQPSTRAASACSSVPRGPEPRTASPGAVLPHLDGDYVRAVWGGPGRLSRQATPLLYALAAEAEAEAGARASEPPSPPASRAAYRQRLQGAQRRVLRETSFQRRELRMSLPARLRPAVPHPRSSSLSHPGRDCRAPAPGAAGQQRKWCFSEPGELDRVGRGGGPAREGPGESCSRPEPHALPCEAGAQHQRTEEPDSGSKKLGGAPWPGRRRQQKASGEALGPWRGPGGAVALVQAVPPGVETPRALFQTFSRVLPQKEAAVVCPAEGPRSSPADCEERVAEPCTEPGRLPSLPDDEVFLDEAPLGRLSLPPEACTPQAAQARVRASDPNSGTGLDRATAPPRCPLHECPGTAGAEDCWQGVNGSTGVARPTSCSLPRTANGDIPATDSTVLLTPATPSAAESDPLKPPPSNALGPSGSAAADPPHHPSLAWGTGQLGSRPIWPSQRLEELVQELAKLDPSLSDTLASDPSPEPPLGLLDGLIPLTEAHAAVRPGEEAAGTSEPRSYPFSFTQLLPASQEKTRPENATLQPVPSQPCVQELPAPNVSIQAKKVELAGLLQNMLQNLHSKQEQLQGGAEAWSRRRAALEAAVRQSCAPRELERFSRFMADLERVLGLLLLLGSRLARVHRALARLGPDGDPEERASLLQRLGLLQRQQEDAQELKEHVSRRERALREVLAQALPEEEVRAYCTLLADKAAVLAQQRNLDEQVRFLQDQLDTIRSDLSHRPLSPRPSWLPKTCLDKQPFPSPPI